MRNAQTETVMSFVEDVMPFMEAAKEYVNTHTKKYPSVYFAAQKNGKYGITLPGVFDIKHSANNCPDGYNTLEFATAWAMKVEDLLKYGTYTYLEWCQKYNYLNRENSKKWYTNAEYIRIDTTKPTKEYALYIPQTGHEYQKVKASKDTPNYLSLKKALYRRNQILYSMIMSGKDLYGVISPSKIKKLSRVLTKGYFQSAFVSTYDKTLPKEERYRRYLANMSTFANVFKNAQRFCEDETLVKAFAFYEKLFANNLGIVEYSSLLENEKIIVEYFKAIGLFKSTQNAIIAISRNEKNNATRILNRFLA